VSLSTICLAIALLVAPAALPFRAKDCSHTACRPTYRVLSSERLVTEFQGARLTYRSAVIGCEEQMAQLSHSDLQKAAKAVKAAAFDGASGMFGFTTDSERKSARTLRKMATERVNRAVGISVASDVIFFDVEYTEPPH